MTTLELLQERVSAPIYLVGGAVRNELIGLPCSDIDICGALSPERLAEETVGLFTVRDVNPRVGTVKLSRGEESFEYTTFRRDSYPLESGQHTPSEVTFVSTPEEDAFRRDFTVNAIYKRVSDGAIIVRSVAALTALLVFSGLLAIAATNARMNAGRSS